MELFFCLQRSNLQDKFEDVRAEVASGELDLELSPRTCPACSRPVSHSAGEREGRRRKDGQERGQREGGREDVCWGLEQDCDPQGLKVRCVEWKLKEAHCSLSGDGIGVWRRSHVIKIGLSF